MTPWLLALALTATIDVPAGASVREALARAKPGDSVRVAAGTFREALRPPPGVAIEGLGPERTVIEPPEGEDGVRAAPGVSLAGLTVRAGPARCALAVNGGEVSVRDVVLEGGSCAVFLESGSVRGRSAELRGGLYGLLANGGEAALEGGSLSGGAAGAAVLRARVSLSRLVLWGRSREAGLSVAGGEARLEAVVAVARAPSGIAVSYGGRVEGDAVTVAGAIEHEGFLGDCVQVLHGEVLLRGSQLMHCGGAALEASGGTVRLDGVEAQGGSAGCLVLIDGARAELQGNRCTGQGPALVAASGAQASLRMNRWRADPAFWVECASGARARILYGEEVREPCAPPAQASPPLPGSPAQP